MAITVEALSFNTSWYLGVGAFVRKNGNKNEFGLGISFTIQQTGDYMPVKFL